MQVLNRLHPIDIGMIYIADFIKEEFDYIYAALPDEAGIPSISDTLSHPLVTNALAMKWC